MKTKKRDYKAILTVYGLDTMDKGEIEKIQNWLKSTAISIRKEQYAKVARFRLMK